MKNNYLGERLAVIIVILNIVITFLLLFNYSLFSFYSSIAIFINSAVISFAIIVNRRMHFYTVIYFGISVSYMMISISINAGGVGSILTFVVSILALDLLSTLNFEEKDNKLLRIFMILVMIGLFIISFKYRTNFDYYQRHDVNPNTIGMFALYAFCIFTSLNLKKRYNFLLLLFVVGTMLNTQSRGTLFSLIAYVILATLPKKIFSKKFIFIITIVLTAVGTAFPFIYVKLYKQGFQLMILNKRLYTGREQLWMRAFNYLGDDPVKWFFGIGSRVQLWNYATNVHNCFFGIIVNFGIIGFILYALYLSRFLKEVGKYARYDSRIKNWFCVFLSTNIILGFTETSIFWSMIFIFANVGLGRAFSLREEQNLKYDS